MAVPLNLLSTFDVGPFSASAHHEDLIDVQVILGSTQTPAFATFRKDRARDVIHSWTVDALAVTSTAGTPEGQTFSAQALLPPVRLTNGTQIFDWGVRVSDRERDANPAGPFRDMYEKQIMMAFKVITRNCEARIFATGVTGSASGLELTSAPLMASILGFSAAAYAGGIVVSNAGSTSGIATADIVRLSQTMFDAGIEPDSIWFATPHKREFFNAIVMTAASVYANVNVRNIAAVDNRFQANVEVMETPFGQLYAIITDRFIPTSSLSASTKAGYYIMDRSMAALAFYRPPQHKPMGKAGDYTEGLVLMECTLRLDHPSGFGMVTGVTAV